MARTVETVVEVGRVTALNPGTYISADATNGHSIENTAQDVILHIKNNHTAAVQATVETGGNIDTDLAIADRTLSIPAGEERFWGPFPNTTYGNDDTGIGGASNALHLDWDVDTSVTFKALKVPTV